MILIKIKGFTLVELLFTMLLFFCLSIVAVSSYTHLLEKNEQQTIVDELKTAVQYAKIQAISLGKPLILSSLDDSSDWSNGAVLGILNRSNKTKEVLHQWQWKHPAWVLTWVGARSEKKIIFYNNPASAISNGHFILKNRDTKKEEVIILNRLGRIKIKAIAF